MTLNKAKYEQGAALIMLIFVMGLALTSYVLKTVNPDKLKRDREQKVMQSLGEAKVALVDWAVNNSVNLGQLPFPDRAGGGGYDGFSDRLPSGTTFRDPESYQFLMGRLPVYGQTSPCVGQQVGLGLDNNEHLENRLWYAVSRNVVHQYEYLSDDLRSNPMINPSIINHPAYPWLTVLDRNGQLVSDRVAAVIMAPNDNLGMQSRADGTTSNQFLDAFYKDGQSYANHDYDSADEDFVMGDRANTIDTQDVSFGRPYLFNDQLVYITIDTLMKAINKRALSESKWLLSSYQARNGYFPNAADLTVATVQSDAYVAGGSQMGFVPFDVTDSCQCMSAEQCDCRFGVVESVTLYRSNGAWKSANDTGACTSTLKSSGKECTCTGAGSCSRAYSTVTTSFSCDADGRCDTQNLTDSDGNQFIYTLPNYADIDGVSENCLIVRGLVKCNAKGDFHIGLNEAAWVKQNGWQQYLYYAWSPTNQLQAGAQQNVGALLIAMGEPIHSEVGVSQMRPSNLVKDYLDSVENTEGDLVYEPVLKKMNATYNDEMLIVSP